MTDTMGMGRIAVHEGQKVRHVCDAFDGIAERVDDTSPIPTVAVRLPTGAVVVMAESFLEVVR